MSWALDFLAVITVSIYWHLVTNDRRSRGWGMPMETKETVEEGRVRGTGVGTSRRACCS